MEKEEYEKILENHIEKLSSIPQKELIKNPALLRNVDESLRKSLFLLATFEVPLAVADVLADEIL